MPILLSAQCLGSPLAAHPKFPTDILLQFLHPCSQDAILKVLRNHGPLLFKRHSIIVLPDLSQEILLKWKPFISTMECLKLNNVCFAGPLHHTLL